MKLKYVYEISTIPCKNKIKSFILFIVFFREKKTSVRYFKISYEDKLEHVYLRWIMYAPDRNFFIC